MRMQFGAVICATAIAILLGASPGPAQAEDADAERTLSAFLGLWSGGPRIDPADVARLYAPRVRYYGRWMSLDQVTREKQSIARRLPTRKYSLVPGSAAAHCDPSRTSCTVTGVLQWTVGPGGSPRTKGGATLSLLLQRDGDGMKIVEERGRVIARARCRGGTCGGYQLPPM